MLTTVTVITHKGSETSINKTTVPAETENKAKLAKE